MEGDDPTILQMVGDGLRKAREKLIDLTMRNGMLNFRHSETSSRHVRIVDENLEFLVRTFAARQSLDIAPLPPVEQIPRDEDTDEFRAALKSAKETDPDWLAAEDARRAAGNRRRTRDKLAERAVRDRVRAALGMTEWRPATDPRARAKELGIDPSYDLPPAGSTAERHHSDREIQTLFFPDRLEPKLSTLFSAARALQEDAGLSALHCAVGYLEYYDPEDAADPAFAPLLLLPVNMGKRIVSGEYVFSVTGRDDDETTNVALREKLRRLGIDLPEYDDEGGIELYLGEVAKAVRNRPRWRVRRFATIGLFSFSRQAMWSDLDPASWPITARPEAHVLLGQIYGDVAGTHSDNVAPVHDVDHPDLEQRAPALITDADASQLSAVIDAATGSNLVVQGPPGTGKSQAITNIIANALWHGKTVLFVSEKMAALNVVKDRLDNFGLGHYCLEVHSAKASKMGVLKAIRERMERQRPAANLQEIENAREALRQTRERLTEYAALMNSPAGSTGLTTHQVLWGDSTRTTQEATSPAGSIEFRLEEPLTVDRFKLGELIGVGRALDEWALSMGQAAKPEQQPWRGIGNLNLSRFDRAKAIEVVARWASTLRRLETLVSRLRGLAEGETLASIGNAKDFIRRIDAIDHPSEAISTNVLAISLDEEQRQSLLSCATLSLEVSDLETKIDAICSRQALATRIDTVQQIEQDALALGVANLLPGEISEANRLAHGAADQLTQSVKLVHELLQLARRDRSAPLDTKAEAMVAGYLHAIRQISQDVLRYRSAGLTGQHAVEDLSEAQAIAVEVRAAADQARFSEPMSGPLAELVPSPQELRQAAATLRGTGFFGKIFGKEWRSAKAIVRRTFAGETIAPNEAAVRLISAALWKEKLQRLEAFSGAKSVSGRHWSGLDTPFEKLIAVAEWMRSISKVTPLTEQGAAELRRLAFETGPDDFEILLQLAGRADELTLVSVFQRAYSARSTIQAEAEKQAVKAASLKQLMSAIEALQLKSEQPISALASARRALAEIGVAQQKIELSAAGLAALNNIRGNSPREKAQLALATLRYVEQLLSQRLPSSLMRHLLTDELAVRLSSLKQLAKDAYAALDEERRAASEASEILKLRDEEWCGATLEVVPLQALLDKCERATQSPDALEKQVSLLATELEAENLGLGRLIRCWPSAGLPYVGIAFAVEAAFYRSAAEKLMREHPILARHAGNTHDQVRKRFTELDREILELNRRMVAAKLHTRAVPPGRRSGSTRDYTDNEMLIHQTGLQQPRIALRRLFSKAGDAVRAYTPCIMMSPMSVAQYLEPGKHVFDLLVIDEASQMRPEDALGAMLRCKQAVVVGDPEQLPPTDFFMASDNGDAEQAEDAPEESILELGRRCWHPMRMLEVHYRSRHHSLIAYSNREFYGERLLVYPSPVREDPAYGVSCEQIDGAYEVGQGRNLKEAQAIVAKAAELMRSRLDQSIGIVAINQAQSDLIETLIDEQARLDPAIQAYREKWSANLEYFFVKNLENVQGDERDIILISTVYGSTAEGVFHQNFGPINRAYGHRRLNVLFTRAKCKLTVFTSLDHGRIVADGSRRGVRVLKEFLEFASRGTITPGRQSGEEPDSDFERWFLSRLKSANYEAHPQVGVAKYRIDIGVVHPDRPGSYILGLECDGATYHSSKSARDRDRLRQDVLERLNWQIYRVWSTDWYRDPEREFSRLVQRIEQLRAVPLA